MTDYVAAFMDGPLAGAPPMLMNKNGRNPPRLGESFLVIPKGGGQPLRYTLWQGPIERDGAVDLWRAYWLSDAPAGSPQEE